MVPARTLKAVNCHALGMKRVKVQTTHSDVQRTKIAILYAMEGQMAHPVWKRPSMLKLPMQSQSIALRLRIAKDLPLWPALAI